MTTATVRVGSLKKGQRFLYVGEVYTFDGAPGENFGIGFDGLLAARSKRNGRRGIVTLFAADTRVVLVEEEATSV